jgi:hypothetical protein
MTSAVIAVAPAAISCAQTNADFRHAPDNGWDAARTSKAVLTNTSLAFQKFAVKKKSGTLTAADSR